MNPDTTTTAQHADAAVRRARVAVVIAFLANGLAFATLIARTPSIRDTLRCPEPTQRLFRRPTRGEPPTPYSPSTTCRQINTEIPTAMPAPDQPRTPTTEHPPGSRIHAPTPPVHLPYSSHHSPVPRRRQAGSRHPAQRTTTRGTKEGTSLPATICRITRVAPHS